MHRCSGCGAFSGEWALLTHDVFDCPVILVEPQPDQRAVLDRLAQKKPFTVEPFALAAEKGILRFQLQQTNSRLVADAESDGDGLTHIEVAVDRLDRMLTRHPAQHPNLLKVDVQGFELAVLDGAGGALVQFEVVILEVSLIRIGPVPVFAEVLAYMAARGYRLYDFLPMYYRPLDGSLWQGDAFFVRNESALVACEDWE